MNKSELIDRVVEDTGLSKSDAAKALDSVTGAITDALKSGDEVAITGFGKFGVRENAARQGVNPSTGEKMQIAASKSPKFNAGAVLKNAVNGK